MFFIVKISMLGDERRGIDVSAPRWAHTPTFQQGFDRKPGQNVGFRMKWKIREREINGSAGIHDLISCLANQKTKCQREEEDKWEIIKLN